MAKCECGCGGDVSIAKHSNAALGHVKGQPVRYIRGHHRRGAYEPLQVRFIKGLPDPRPSSDDCWEWQAARVPGGYGSIYSGTTRLSTHRLAWELANGPIPKGLWVLHHCDNPPCCNPAHLFLGTQADNDRDRIEKGRTASPGAKLSVDDVREIRYALSLGAPPIDLARSYGVTNTTICDIGSRKTWKSA